MSYESSLEKQNEELQKKLAGAQNQLSRLKACNNLRIPTLNSKWVDRDEVLLHTVFTVLVEFIEGEWHGKCEQYSKADYDAEFDKKAKKILYRQNRQKRELYSLYMWWKNVYPELCKDPHWHIRGYETETKKAARVVELRKYLWT
jgi:hypothetical protein